MSGNGSRTPRKRRTPYDRIVERADIPPGLKPYLPSRWEKLGDVLLIKLPSELIDFSEEVARAYAGVLEAKTVLRDLGVSGTLRRPKTELIWGTDTETVHLENDVRFALDPSRVMFSSGNIDERIRMATIPEGGEVVADMFAGIGYFSIPIAVHSRPAEVLACELNPEAFGYLEKNIVLNRVEDIVRPMLGDCRDAMPEGLADRVLMGYVGNTHEFLDKALRVLKPEGGTVHYHETCPNELLDSRPLERMKAAVDADGRRMEVLNTKVVKSYAPGVSHMVQDIEIR